MPNATRAAELRSLAFLRHEGKPDVFELELLRQPLHDIRRARDLFAEKNGLEFPVGDERFIRLQVNSLQPLRRGGIDKKIALVG